jgi:hypothetical protein
MFFYTLEERGPCHEVCEVEVEVIVFGEGVEVAEVELQEVTGSDSADSRHLLLPVLGPLKILSLVSDVDKKRRVRESECPEIWRSDGPACKGRQGPHLAQSPATPIMICMDKYFSTHAPTHFYLRCCWFGQIQR